MPSPCPRRAAARRAGLVAAGVAVALLGGCASPATRSDPRPLDTWIGRARFPVAPVALPDGGLLYGERLTGRIRRVDARGRLAPRPLAVVPAVGAPDDQRGLLGLARTPAGTVYATWTRADRRIVVAAVAPGTAPATVWVGPRSAARANGGALTVAADGRLLIGIGDLLTDRDLADDPTVPNRKILVLEPDAPATQEPQILSTGWNNPYAITVDARGVPWVADNTGGRAPERIGRADRPAARARPLRADGRTVAPAGLVALPRHRLGVCGFVSGRLDEYVTTGMRARPTGRVLARPCRIGATQLRDGRIVTLTPSRVLVIPRTAAVDGGGERRPR